VSKERLCVSDQRPYTTLSRRYLWQSRWYNVRQDQLRNRSGGELIYTVIEKPPAVWVVPVTADGELVLIDQYRYTVDAWCQEVPAGNIEPGLDAPGMAARELREEIGLECAEKPERWLRLSASENTGMEFVWIYRMQSEGPFTLNEAEISEGAWFAPDEISEGIVENPDAYAGSFRYFWPRVRDELP